MADHRTLTSVDVHEPKHITDSSGTDAGKVITPAASAGTSELRLLIPAEVGVTFDHGRMAAVQSVTSTAYTAGDLYSQGDYTLLTSVLVPGMALDQANGVTIDTVNNTLEVSTAGVYRISGWLNVSSDTAAVGVGIRYTLNSVVSGESVIHTIAAVDKTENIAFNTLADISAEGKVGIAMAADTNSVLGVEDFNLTLELIEAT